MKESLHFTADDSLDGTRSASAQEGKETNHLLAKADIGKPGRTMSNDVEPLEYAGHRFQRIDPGGSSTEMLMGST
ncbi:hypothetical protein Chor_001673 [Crotalus horridus]